MAKTALVSKKPTKADRELINKILAGLTDFAEGRFDEAVPSTKKR